MQTYTITANCPTGRDGYTAANRTANAVLTLSWLRNIASYDGWPERAAAYRAAR